jgi:DNA repair exonuclease SbcCD ATPase subunit
MKVKIDMQVLKYEAHNVLGVKDIKFDLAGRHLFLVGGANGQGKSSALTALVMALAGKSGMPDYPDIALRNGEKKGKVTIELTGDSDLMESKSITVELSLRKKTTGSVVEEFRVLDSTGEEAPEPRKLLQRLFTLRAFDPLAFERMKPKEKATLVSQMLGLDLSKFDKEYNRVFEDRTVLGRDGKKLSAQFEAAPKHADAPTEEVKVVDLMTELEKLQGENRSRANMEILAEDLGNRQVELTLSADKLVDQIADLQIQLQNAKDQIAMAEKAQLEARQKLDGLPDRTPDIAAVKDKIAKADETNRKVRENAARETLEKELKKSRGDYQKLSDRLTEIQEERADTVSQAKWPMPGMELTEDGLLMNGLPFEQASTSQRIMASVKVGMALNPKLRLLVCQHGSDLDNETLDALAKVVEEHQFQLLIELVTRSKEDEERCAVIIADGEVVGATKAQDTDESSGMDENSMEEK